MEIIRCNWATGNDILMQNYHDKEWGRATHDAGKLFEFLILESFQAGLSWKTILHKREGFKEAFENFDAQKICQFTNEDVERLMLCNGIIKNRLKIKAAINNAAVFLEIQKNIGGFDAYMWQFTEGKTIQNKNRKAQDVPITTATSDAMARQLKKDGFKFMGSITCYAYMQAMGMVNDHLITCGSYRDCAKK